MSISNMLLRSRFPGGGLVFPRTVSLVPLVGAMVLGLLSQDADAVTRLEGHGGPVRGLDVHDDTVTVVTASFDYSAILWDVSGDAPRLKTRLLGHDAAVNDAVFVPGKDLLVTGSDDGSVAVWDVSTGDIEARFHVASGKKFVDVAVSPNGSLAAGANWDTSAYVYDLETMEIAAELHGHRGLVNAIEFSRDGSLLFTGSYDGTIRMWDPKTGKLHRTVYNHGWAINTLRVLEGDSNLLLGAVDGAVHIINIETGDVIIELEPHEGPTLALALDDAGRFMASGGGDGRIHLYSVDGWVLEENHQNPFGPVWGLNFIEGKQMLLHAGLDDFVIGWQFSPRKPFETVEAEFPRRFQQQSAEMDPGEEQFARKCSVCHTLSQDDANRAGPTLYGVFGREAGTLQGYPFSKALVDSTIVWDDRTIAKLFDLGPDIVTPGTKMPIQRIKEPEKLEALVAYLREATAPQENDSTPTKKPDGGDVSD